MDRLVEIVQGSLLLIDAQSDGGEVAGLVAEAWFAEKLPGAGLALKEWKPRIQADLKIVFGPNGPEVGATPHL
jgi:hypothetical protein